MSSLHLQHLISWSNLQQLLVEEEDKGLQFAIDSAHRIHITSRALGIQVENRPYLQGYVCNSRDCAIVGTAIFHKRKKQRLSWKLQLRTKEDFKVMRRFVESLAKAIEELRTSKLEKAKAAVADMTSEFRAGLFTEKLVQCSRIGWRGEWEVLFELIAHGDLETILALHEEKKLNLLALLNENLGGQAIGNGFYYLIACSLLPFYLESNMIIANNLQAQEDKWHVNYTADGHLKYSHHCFTEDCDGRTFPEHLRPALKKGVFMCDLERTQELLKQVFDVIVTYFAVCKFCNFTCHNESLGNTVFDAARYGFSSYQCYQDDLPELTIYSRDK